MYMRRRWPVVAFVVAVAIISLVIYTYLNQLAKVESNVPGIEGYSLIEEGLYLGAQVPNPPPSTRAVLNLCEKQDPYQVEIHSWDPIPDAAPAPSLIWLRQQVEFIDAQRRAGLPVFVHCSRGISRSALVVVAYLMSRNGWSRDEALAHVKSKRPAVRPNPAFMELLLDWEKLLKVDHARASVPITLAGSGNKNLESASGCTAAVAQAPLYVHALSG